MANATETVVERELVIAAAPETVWELLVDPEQASAWMGLQSWSDPRPGGVYRVEVIPGKFASGEYVELDPPSRLVFTWGWEDDGNAVPAGSSRIEFELTADGDGTHVRFVHSGLPSAEAASRAICRRDAEAPAWPGPHVSYFSSSFSAAELMQ